MNGLKHDIHLETTKAQLHDFKAVAEWRYTIENDSKVIELRWLQALPYVRSTSKKKRRQQQK